MLEQIDEVVQFLRGFAPDTVPAFVARHPEAKPYFEGGGLALGGMAELGPAVDAACVMLDSVDEVASAAMQKTVANLKSARLLDVVGSLLALIASGGVVGTLLGADDKRTAAILGGVGFVASAVPLVSSWVRGAPVGDRSIGQCFLKLRELTWDARLLRAEFAQSADPSALAPLVGRANELAKDAFVVLSDLGYDPKLRPL